MIFNAGVVITVVTNAMITTIENKADDRMPRSKPTFKTISSTKPRVLSRKPSASELRASNPAILAPVKAPPTFPAIATAITSAVTPRLPPQCAGVGAQAGIAKKQGNQHRHGKWFDLGCNTIRTARPDHSGKKGPEQGMESGKFGDPARTKKRR